MNISLNFNSQHVNRKALIALFSIINLFVVMIVALSFTHQNLMAQSIIPPTAVTYLRTDAPPLPTGNNAVGGDITKNHQIIRNNTDDGFLQVMAGLTDVSGTMKWHIRLIAIDNGHNLLWSKELVVQESVGVTISTVPFSICQNLNNDGFVIAGIVDNRLGSNLKLNHEGGGTQRPFFMEIDDFGNVTQLKVGDFISPMNSVYSFVPFTICKRGNNQGYMAAGLMTTDVSVLNASHRGYISKLDAAFDEIDGTIMTSTQGINAHPIVNKPERFDLITKIKPVPNEEDNYIICGAITENLFESSMFKHLSGSQFLFYARGWDNPPSYEYAAGSSQGYIAKISENFALAPIWENKIMEETNHHCNFVDFTFDEHENTIYVIGNTIAKFGSIATTFGSLFILDKSTGSTHHGGYLRGHTNHTESFWTNIYVGEDNYYACGFTLDINTPINYSTPFSFSKGLNPYVMVFDKTSHNYQSESFMIRGRNENYLSNPILEGFIQYLYPNANYYPNNGSYVIMDYNNKSYYMGDSDPYHNVISEIKMHSPTSWTPNAWLRNEEGELTCLAVRKASYVANGTHFPSVSIDYPTIWGNGNVFGSLYIHPSACGIAFDELEQIFQPEFDLAEGNHTSWIQNSIIEYTAKPHFDTVTYYVYGVECPFISLPPDKISNDHGKLIKLNQIGSNHWRLDFINDIIIPAVQNEPIDPKNYKSSNKYHIEVYDLSGRKIITQQNVTFPYDINNLRMGMYIVHITSKDGYAQNEKITILN